MPDRAPRSHLPHFLAGIWGLAIVYASLQPFANWTPPPPGTPFFLFGPWPAHWTRFDVLANVLAYAPFGFFAALMPRDRPWAGRLALAIVAGAGLSLPLEALQTFAPMRDASAVDLMSNVAGALVGGAAAVALARAPRARRAISLARQRLFLAGAIGDLGLALVAVWLAVQVNPGIPLFASMFEAAPRLGPPAGEPDLAAAVVEGAHSAFQLLGVGLFLALLLRERRHVGGAVLLLIGAALFVKGVGAAMLLKPAAWGQWLSPGVSIGVAVGTLLLSVAIWLPRPAQAALAAIALLSSLLATILAPGLVDAQAPLVLFDWSYGQLLNFNGLTHTVLVAWPFAATLYLFVLAGRPGWGHPH